MQQLITAARTLGSGPLSVYLEDSELLRLCAVIAVDLGLQDIVGELAARVESASDYYAMPLEWFARPIVTTAGFHQVFAGMRAAEPDFPTYFKALCEIHKRRRKFQLILQRQALPQLAQIVPRCLLEYGLKHSEALASWLVWRKWLYDIDNRAAQETGYLFEPILASALGGVPYAASRSPVKRADRPTRGRQVDCIDGKTAYEFKMRVTIAASGQGRFGEELDFARDCHSSGYMPVLLVLDPTPSQRLVELTTEYQRYGGGAYIGEAAWQHIADRAGRAMGIFVDRYVRAPRREVDAAAGVLQPIYLEQTATSLQIRLGDDQFTIPRSEPPIDTTSADEPPF